MKNETLHLSFGHGLGDCANFAHVLALYTKRGYTIRLSCTPDKAPVFAQPGVEICECSGAQGVPWWESHLPYGGGLDCFGQYNKAARGISVDPLPSIGFPTEELWDELCAVRLDLPAAVPKADTDAVAAYLADLPKPIVLIHSKGNTGQELKSIPDAVIADVYGRLLDGMAGTLLILDWDDRVPKLFSSRVRHLPGDGFSLPTSRLIALMAQSDLLLGIDSGPFHLARAVGMRSVGVFSRAEHYPSKYVLPHPSQVCLVPGVLRDWNRQIRGAYNLVECPGDTVDAATIADACLAMLGDPLFFYDRQIGQDVQFRQFLSWQRGGTRDFAGVGPVYVDRRTSLELLYQEADWTFMEPSFVETGCIRAPEDWAGAGYMTYQIGMYLRSRGGNLTSVDIDEGHCAFAASVCAGLPVKVVQSDSVAYLKDRKETIDVLILDSMDADIPGHADHALAEVKAALPIVHRDTMILFDDTMYARGSWQGKGALGVPFLLERGWRVLYSGYQTLLCRMEHG